MLRKVQLVGMNPYAPEHVVKHFWYFVEHHPVASVALVRKLAKQILQWELDFLWIERKPIIVSCPEEAEKHIVSKFGEITAEEKCSYDEILKLSAGMI